MDFFGTSEKININLVSFWLDVASSPQVKIFVLSREVKILLLSLNKLG